MLQLSQGSLRLGPAGGFLGFDMGVVIQIAKALGYDEKTVTELVGESQGVIVEKMNEDR
ncbi:MAG: hypothetical protein ACAH80_18615 [Alphaproteobacteria bacterium]